MKSYAHARLPLGIILYVLRKDYRVQWGLVPFLLGLYVFSHGFCLSPFQLIRTQNMSFYETSGVLVSKSPTGKYLYGYEQIAYDYEFQTKEGETIQGRSYYSSHVTDADVIRVQVSDSNPKVNKLRGSKAGYCTVPFILGLMIMSVSGIGLFNAGKYCFRFGQSVLHGYITKSKLVKRPNRNNIRSIDSRFIYYEFTTRHSGEIVTIPHLKMTSQNEVDEREELILYSERNPNRNYFVDRFPKKLKAHLYAEYNRALKSYAKK